MTESAATVRHAAAGCLWTAAGRRGNAAVEWALTAVPLFLFLFGIIAAGQAMWLQNALDASVAEAARCASVNPSLCDTAEQIQAYAARQTGAGFEPSIFSVTTASCGHQVSARYPMALMIPFLSLSITLTAKACFPS